MNRKVRKVIRKCTLKFQRIRLNFLKEKSKKFNNFSTSMNFTLNKDNFIKNYDKKKYFRQDIEDAESIINHEFKFLGIEKDSVGDKINWHKDYKSNFIWEKKYFADIKTIDLSNDADVKIPWEMSRLQHFFALGKAYYITEDEKYTIEFKEEFLDWIYENKVGMSVNWACTMDVAIRAINLVYAYNFFKESKILNEDFWNIFNTSIYNHAKFIRNNLENLGVNTGNHYLSNIVGLLFCSIYLRNINDRFMRTNIKNWIKFSVKELEKEIFIQVNNDGTNYEASTSYHRLVTELFLHAYIIGNNNNIKFSNSYKERLKLMIEFIFHLSKPNLLSPLIGDSDDGRVVIISNYNSWERRDFTHILALGAFIFNENKYSYYIKDKNESLWIFGKVLKNIKGEYNYDSIEFRDSGYYILKNKRIYCLVRCGQLSFHSNGGGHSHNDQLSIDLNVDGKDFFVDPGVYVYTRDYKLRNLFRSTKVHNTVFIDGIEQNKIYDKNLFYLNDETKACVVKFEKNLFEGIHSGYINKIGSYHKRRITLKENELLIEDIINLNNFKGFINFTLNNNVKIYNKNYGFLLVNDDSKIKLITNLKGKILKGKIAYRYGEIVETNRLVLEIENQYSKLSFLLDNRS